MNQKDADEWYPMEPIALKMSKKKKIALLEKQVADLQRRILALEAQQTAPMPAVSPYPWTEHWTLTVGPSDAVDLTPRVAMESTDGVRCGTTVIRNGHEEPAILGP